MQSPPQDQYQTADTVRPSWLAINTAAVMIPFSYRNSPPTRYAKVKAFLEELRGKSERHVKIGVVGFCWGGWHVTQLASGEAGSTEDGRSLVDACFTAHPSALTVPRDIEEIILPYSVVIGDKDFAMDLKSVEQMRDVLARKSTVASEVVVLPGAAHGFAVRADPEDKGALQAAQTAEDQMVAWFGKHLAA